MRSLADAGLVCTITGEYPLLTLTQLGDKVMRGETSFQLVWPDPEAGRKEVALKDQGHDGQLYTMLRDLRAKMAKRDDVPPYVIFSNKTLEALTRYQPINAEEALHIPGIGVAKIQRYAESFSRSHPQLEKFTPRLNALASTRKNLLGPDFWVHKCLWSRITPLLMVAEPC